jgi:hypothetical protein
MYNLNEPISNFSLCRIFSSSFSLFALQTSPFNPIYDFLCLARLTYPSSPCILYSFENVFGVLFCNIDIKEIAFRPVLFISAGILLYSKIKIYGQIHNYSSARTNNASLYSFNGNSILDLNRWTIVP